MGFRAAHRRHDRPLATPDPDGPSNPRRRSRSRVPRLVGAVLLIAAAVGGGYPAWWSWRQDHAADRLLHGTATAAPATTRTGQPGSTATATTPTATDTTCRTDTAADVLTIDATDLTAPILPGLTDDVLDIAVGHDPSTPAAGKPGMSVLVAHDVGYFSALDKVADGAAVTVTTGCTQHTFTVTGHQVLRPGDPIPTSTTGTGLALVTCWPTTALWWTPERYVVTATLTSTTTAGHTVQVPPAPTPLLTTIPAEMTTRNLGIGGNSISLGMLTVQGSPSATWAQSPAPLDAQVAALKLLFAARIAVTEDRPDWWTQLAPGVVMPQQWSPTGTVDITETVVADQVQSVTIHYPNATLTVVVHDRTAQISGFTG